MRVCKVSYYRDTFRDREQKLPKGIDKKFKAWRRLNKLERINDKEYIKSLFDNPEEVEYRVGKYSRTYEGKIASIEVNLYIRNEKTPLLYAETDEKASVAHEKIFDRIVR